jgi:hypothetical protein
MPPLFLCSVFPIRKGKTVMDLSRFVSTLASVAPTIALALGGPVAGLATTALSQALTGKPDTTSDQIGLMLAKPNADQFAKLKEAEQSFTQKMKELDIDVMRLAAADLASARQREMATGDHATPRLLAFLVSIGFFGILGFMLMNAIPSTGKEALLVMLGALGTGWTAVLSYYFGSSAGSFDKNAVLQQLARSRQQGGV